MKSLYPFRMWLRLGLLIGLVLVLSLGISPLSPARAEEPGSLFAWSLEMTVDTPAEQVQAMGGVDAVGARLLETVRSRLSNPAVEVSARFLESSEGGATYLLSLEGRGDADMLRQVLFVDLGKDFDFLGGPIALTVIGGVAVDDELVVMLDARPSTGYSWGLVEGDPAILQSLGEVESEQLAGMPGSPARQTLRLKALISGSAELSLAYRRPFEPDASPTRRLRVVADRLPAILDLSDPLPPVSYPQPELPIGDLTELAEPVTGLPASYDLRDYGWVPPIRNQGSCGSCWAFGTVGAMEIAMGKASLPLTDLSEQYLISCNQSGYSCNGGWWAHSYHLTPSSPYARWGLNNNPPGAVLEVDKPYTATNGSCSAVYNHPYVLADWDYVSSNDIASENEIKNAVFNFGPVATSLCVGTYFENYGCGILTGDDASACGANKVNHAVIIIGWKDPEGSNPGYWIVRNSWGTWWGESGYVRIKWGISNIGYGSSYVTGPSTQGCYTLTTQVSPAGAGSVSANPAPNCEGNKYQPGTQVQLTANANAGWIFSSWSGNASGTSNPVTVTMNGNRTVTANFNQRCYVLTRSHTGSGSDPVATPVKSVGCVTGQYHAGEVITVSASPANGWTVGSWSGTGNNSSTSTTNTLTMPTSDHTVTVNYAQLCYALTTNINPAGSGAVSANPLPNCGDKYLSFTQVQLTAQPAGGYGHKNWTGDVVSSLNPVTVTMDSDKSVTANFGIAPNNDNIANAVEIGNPGGVISYAPGAVDVTAATVESSDPRFPNNLGQRYRTVWYRFRPFWGGTLRVNTQGSSYDTLVGVWKGVPGSLELVRWNDNVGTRRQAGLSFSVAAGTEYWIEVASKGAGGGELVFSLKFTPRRTSNNLLRYAIGVVDSGGGLEYSKVEDVWSATVSEGDPEYSQGPEAERRGYRTVWYRIKPKTSGRLEVDTVGSNYDTLLGVYRGPGGGLVTMGQDDNGGGGGASRLEMWLVGGVTYYIEVASQTQDEHTRLQVNLRYTPVSPVVPGLPMTTYDADDGNGDMIWLGGWSYDHVNHLPAVGGTLALSSEVRDVTGMTFNGTRVKVSYARLPEGGVLQVILDGQTVAYLSQKGSVAGYGKSWTSGLLKAGTHQITLVHYSGGNVNVDAITITP